MISRPYRFHGHNTLRRLYSKGLAARGQSLTLRYLPNDRRRQPRVAVIVSRKVHKSAVVRNRIRRRIYEAVRRATLPDSPVIDMAFIVYDDRLAYEDAAVVERAIGKLLRKAGFTARARGGIVESKE